MVGHRLVEDLGKLGPVRVVADGDADGAEELALVERLADGATVAQAARQVGLSLRTAHRRLAAIRERVGVVSNAELVVRSLARWQRQPGLEPQRHDGFGERCLSLVCRCSLASASSPCWRNELRRPGPWLSSVRPGSASPRCCGPSVPRTPVVCAKAGVSPPCSGCRILARLQCGRSAPRRGGCGSRVAHCVCEAVGDAVLILDDLHWVDSATLSLLGRLVGRIRVLGAIRSGAERAADALHVSLDVGFECLELGAPPVAVARMLVAELHPTLSAADRDRVVDGGGNPLLLEELVGAGSPTLRASLLARLAPLPDAANDTIARLALPDGRSRPSWSERVSNP